MKVRAVYFAVQDVGKHMKKSKKRFIWKFQVDGHEHVLEMFVSYMSGKKQIILDGRSLYEAQKMTSSFQFPFQVENASSSIVQHGDQFELRINNQVFSHLYNQERMKREFQFEGGSGNPGNDDDDFGSRKKTDFGGYGREEKSYQSKSEFSFEPRQPAPKREQPKKDDEGGLGFASEFEKFDYKSSKPQNDPFESYGNKYSEDAKRSKPQSDSFSPPVKQQSQSSAFDQFGSPPKPQTQQSNSGFANFGDFSNFSQPEQPKAQPQSQPKPQPTKVTADDLLGLDFGGGSQPQQPTQPTNQNAGGFDDFFGGGAPVEQTPTNTNQQQALNQAFQNSNVAPQNQNQSLANDFGNLGLGGSTPQNQPFDANAQAQAQKKKDLWDTDLVSLNPTDAFGGNQNQKKQNEFDYLGGGGMGNMGGGYNTNMGNMGNMGGGFNTGYGGGYGTPSNQGFGGYGTPSNQGFGGMSQNQGFGGMSQNQGFGGMSQQNQGFGGMNQQNQGFNTNMGMGQNQQGFGGNMSTGMNMNTGMGGGFGGNQGNAGFNQNANNNFGMNTYQQGGTTTADVTTPFDF